MLAAGLAILYNGGIRAQGSVNQLLEKQESVRLTMPSLPPDTMKKVLEMIREKIGKEPEVDHPSMNLEQFFLEVVEKAYKTTTQQSGAAPTEGMADYLSTKDR